MRARSLLSLSLLCGVLGAQGCGADFDPGSRVTSLRVLAVSADARWGSADPTNPSNVQGQSYARPGETVWLSAEWYAPVAPYAATPDTRPRKWVWLRCIDPDDTSVVGCIKAIGQEAKETGDITKAFLNVPDGTDQDVVKVTIPSDAITRLPENARTNATVGVVLLVCPGDLNLASGNVDLTSITSGQIPLECDDASTHQSLPLDQWVAGIKRIFVRDTARNANPAIASITWDGADWPDHGPDGKPVVQTIKPCDDDGNRYDRCTTDQHQIAVALTPNSVESGTDPDTKIDFQEQVVVEFYSTEGTFEHEVKIASSANTGFAARKQSKDGLRPIKMWIVVHDNRGGVVWAERIVQPVAN